MATLFKWDAAPVSPPALLSDDVQQQLSRWNHVRLAPGLPDPDWEASLEHNHEMQRLEGQFLEQLRAEVRDEAAAVPRDPHAFMDWFEALKEHGPGQGDPLFPWLANIASREEMRWYLTQEAAGEAGFDDLVAMTQVKLPERVKLELARNYWDEMGRGNAKGMHGPMLDGLVEALELKPRIEATAWESLALANAMTAMATRRDLAWHSVGALGAVEMTAPERSAAVADGLERLGVPQRASLYFKIHAVLDVKHSDAWNTEAIRPAVEEDPRRAVAMAEGALIRLRCGQRCFEHYRSRLW